MLIENSDHVFKRFLDGESIEPTNLSPRSASDYLAQARAFDINGRHQSVIRLASKSIEMLPTSEAFFIRGYSFKQMGLSDKAIDDYTRSIRLSPSRSLQAYQ